MGASQGYFILGMYNLLGEARNDENEGSEYEEKEKRNLGEVPFIPSKWGPKRADKAKPLF